MKLSTSVTVKGLKELTADLHTVEELKPLHGFLERVSKVGTETAQARAPRYTQHLADSFVFDIEPFSARVHTISDKYAVVMEGGRKPGKMPPPRELARWASAHGIESTFLLARAIARRGIKGRFFKRKAASAVRKEIPPALDEMAKKLEGGWGNHAVD